MPKIQQTFTLIDPTVKMQNLIQRRPNEALPELAPMMTSKQAQKRWREQNRQPRMSKEEQRRMEREEQARIKAEFEKEKASKRAKFLRDKKKEKEQKMLEEKRKKGLPLVDVHPSQSTLASFFRQGVATKRKLAEITEPEEDESVPRPNPTQRERQQRACDDAQPAPSCSPSPAANVPVQDGMIEARTTTAMLPPPSTRLTPRREVASEVTPAPPSSTQFLVENLEDFFPTPSQMDRELEEEFGTSSVLPTVAKQPTPTTVSRPPVPLFGDGSRAKINNFAPHIQTPLVPLPDQVPTSKLVDRIKNAIDYFSSQDWELSSQDIRELGGTTTTPSKVTRPPAMEYNYPPPSNQENLHGSPEHFRPFRKPSQAGSPQSVSAWQSNIALRHSPTKSHQSSPQPQPSLPKLPLSPVAPPPASAKENPVAPQSSEPPRFFGSSGNGVEELMRRWEAHKAAEKEKWERQEAEKKRLVEEKRQQAKKEKQQQVEKEKLEEIADNLLVPLSQCSIHNGDIEEARNAGQGDNQSQGAVKATVAASQAETDYGDDEFGELEEEAISLLDAVATASTPTATTLPTVTVTTPNGGGIAGGAMAHSGNAVDDPAVSFGLGDGDWLADENELDLDIAGGVETQNNNTAHDPSVSFGLGDGDWLADDDELDF